MGIDGYAAAFVAILFIFILCHWRWNKNSPIINWPLVGMLPGFVSNVSRIHDYATEILEKVGYTIVFKAPWFVSMNFLATIDPENIHYVLSTNHAKYPKGGTQRENLVELGDGIITADSNSWKAQRKLIHSLFKHNSFQLLVENTAQLKVEKGLFPILEHHFKHGMEVDMQDLLHRFTFDLTCIFLFGFDPKSLSVELPHFSIFSALDEIEEVWVQRYFLPRRLWKLQKWLQIGKEKKVSHARKTCDNFIYHHISVMRERSKSKTPQKGSQTGEDCDIVTSFIEEEEKESSNTVKMPDSFVRDSVMNLLVAGKDTASIALAWFFWLLAKNPSVENKIREEMKAHFQVKDGEEWRFVSFEALNKLVYLHAALCESLRLYPPIPFNIREAVQPDILPSGHHVDSGTTVVFFNYAMGRMEKIWGEDCAEFNPGRWISERGEIIRHPSYKFVSFSAGPRSCVGKDLAFIQMKIVASAVVWNYHLQLVEDHLVLPVNSLTLRMKHGLKVKVDKRCQGY